MASIFDFDTHYELSPDLLVIQRNPTTVQIGTDEPRRVLITDAPAGTQAFLTDLPQTAGLGMALKQTGPHERQWRAIAEQLLRRGLLVARPPARGRCPELSGEHLMLTHRHGFETADRMMISRSDAVIVVDGDTVVADVLTDMLGTLGIGHVHQRSPGVDAASSGDRRAARKPPRADMTWHTPIDVRVHRPAPQVRPTAVVLAGDSPPDPGRAAELVTLVVPHLPVHVAPARCVVGPFVLPGRTPCLNCLERHRIDNDTDWPAVVESLRARPLPTSTWLASMAAVIAAAQLLDFVDGTEQPDSIGASLEFAPGSTHAQRRVWGAHTECRCRNLPGR